MGGSLAAAREGVAAFRGMGGGMGGGMDGMGGMGQGGHRGGDRGGGGGDGGGGGGGGGFDFADDSSRFGSHKRQRDTSSDARQERDNALTTK